ncbi:hypothetical protein ABWH92_10640 [Ahrensia marina]|uniref:hypothetical protein n=1 Tax=Ahrensia marina TaxID=1514904 RepID=UPI0035CF22D5
MSFERKQLKPVSVRRGLRFSAPAAPSQTIDESKTVKAAALLGVDYPGLRPRFLVEVGERVREGQTLFVDRKDDAVCFASPIAGEVFAIEFGPRRTLSALVVRAKASDDGHDQLPDDAEPLSTSSRETIRAVLLSQGLWPAFRSRPFGLVPASDEHPAAIFVTAIDLSPGAVDPDPVIAAREKAFRQGLEVLGALTDGEVFVCQAKSSTFRVPESVTMRAASFEGTYQAGLASTHIHQLFPATPDSPVWTIGFQDVIALGTLFLTGRYDASRVVALTGSPLERSKLVRAPLGADIRGLLEGEIDQGTAEPSSTRALSGSSVSGRDGGYLGRYHTQISVVSRRSRGARPDWTRRLPFFGTNSTATLVPNTTVDRALPANILAIPMMRALSVGDAQAAKRLGALDLVEEDVAALNHICTSGADYRPLLRAVLDELAEDAA